jgi:hypothetical protein
MLGLSAAAWGQEAPPDEVDPELTDPSIDEVVREMIDRPDDVVTISPRGSQAPRPAAPGDAAGSLVAGIGDQSAGWAPLLPEDSFVSRGRGRLVRLATGDWVFVFFGTESGLSFAPMVVLPCRELERAEGVVEDPSLGSVFDITGQVYVYRGRNYILPSASLGLVHVAPEPEGGEDAPAIPASVEPDIAAIIATLEAERESHRVLSALPPAATEGPVGVREGEFLLRRRGRMTRMPGGQWAFTTDNDAEAPEASDPALILTPSRNLMAMEGLAGRWGEDLVVEVTGRALVYKQRPYLVVLMYQVVREGDVRPLQ